MGHLGPFKGLFSSADSTFIEPRNIVVLGGLPFLWPRVDFLFEGVVLLEEVLVHLQEFLIGVCAPSSHRVQVQVFAYFQHHLRVIIHYRSLLAFQHPHTRSQLLNYLVFSPQRFLQILIIHQQSLLCLLQLTRIRFLQLSHMSIESLLGLLRELLYQCTTLFDFPSELFLFQNGLFLVSGELFEELVVV